MPLYSVRQESHYYQYYLVDAETPEAAEAFIADPCDDLTPYTTVFDSDDNTISVHRLYGPQEKLCIRPSRYLYTVPTPTPCSGAYAYEGD